MNIDERLLLLARTRGHSDPKVERAVATFSKLGEHGGVWLAIGAAGWALDRERAPSWLRVTATVGGVYALNTAIKLAVRRPRPRLPGLPPLTGTPTQLSFPSAHASTSFAAAGLYARLGLPAPLLYALAGGLALSRLYLGVHYPSDVLAGAGLGAVVARATRLGSPGGSSGGLSGGGVAGRRPCQDLQP
ncbi:MAG TPA: phosphatase PAP2 family protein [Solirubrobacteraceae bacterium]|nr:phosphatase PAP2 family protein [Solirubrobacteraceae bacterium]